MRDMIHDNQKKVQAIKAWGWFIYLLIVDASKNTSLINEMLKIPESTFTDSDPQVQIATMVSYLCKFFSLLSGYLVKIKGFLYFE